MKSFKQYLTEIRRSKVTTKPPEQPSYIAIHRDANVPGQLMRKANFLMSTSIGTKKDGSDAYPAKMYFIGQMSDSELLKLINYLDSQKIVYGYYTKAMIDKANRSGVEFQ